MKLLGREPATIVGAVSAVIALVVSLGIGLDAEHAALVMAVVSALGGLLTAWTTVDTRLGLVIGVVQAVIALVVGYGLTVSDQLAGSILALVPVVFSFIQRDRTTPAETPLSSPRLAA